MQKFAYKVLRAVHHNGVLYSSEIYPYTTPVIFAYPEEVAGALSVGAIELDPTLEVPPEEMETPPTPSTGTATKNNPLLKPIA